MKKIRKTVFVVFGNLHCNVPIYYYYSNSNAPPCNVRTFSASEESFSDMCCVLVTTLVTVAKGRSSGGSNNYGFYPFGKSAAESIESFKAIPSTWFGIVIAAMYPFVQKDQSKWEKMDSKPSHPMTQL